MSLIRPVIRMSAMGALLNNTLAQSRVFDSDNSPLASMLTTEAQPYIVIYTDEDNRVEIVGTEIYPAERNLSLVVEMGVAAAIEVPVEGSSPIRKVQIPATDAGLEAIVDIMESEVIAGLFGDPRNPWAEILRRIIHKFIRVPSHRAGSAERGTRWAARQIVFVCNVLADPPPGIVLPDDHPVRDFITLAEQTSPLIPAASIIATIVNENRMPEWREAQAWLTLTRAGVETTELPPLFDVKKSDEEPYTLDDLALEDVDTEYIGRVSDIDEDF